VRAGVLAAVAALVAFLPAAEARAPAPGPCAVLCGDLLPSWSPDGRTIGFIHYVRGATGSPRQTLYTVPAAGGPMRALVGLDALNAAGGPSGPFGAMAWSPDSTQVAFNDVRGGLWTVPAAGGAVRGTGGASPVSWSPDGRRITFERPTYVEPSFREIVRLPGEIVTSGVDGSDVRVLAGSSAAAKGGRWAALPLWSATGPIAYVTGERPAGSQAPNYTTAEIWSIQPDGSGARRLVASGAQGGYALLAWAGNRLFFKTYGLGSIALEAVNGDGSGRTLIRDLGGDAACCWVSPEGTRLAFLRTDAEQLLDLYVLTLADGTERRLASGLGLRSASGIAWSPAGDRIAFVNDGECRRFYGVHTVSVQGSDPRRLTDRCRRDGTSRADVLQGGIGPDALYGHGGPDSISGGAGQDFLQGGAGDDIVRGGPGNDRVFGGPGRDRLVGDAGSDEIGARDGARDIVGCGTGRDSVSADRLDTVAHDCELVQRR
jgi:Tol biopolymer transport system component